MSLSSLLLKKDFSCPSSLIIEGESHFEFTRTLALKEYCESRSACKICAGCKKVEKQIHPDWIHHKGDLKIDELREALYSLRLRSFSGRRRLLSFSEFENSSTSVQNALLKSLEEPFENWWIILGLQSASGLLPTVKSRCLLLRLPPSNQTALLDEKEMRLFNAISNKDDLEIYSLIEPQLKSREHFLNLLKRMTLIASASRWPNHWHHMALHVERAFEDLDRNLNARNVWDVLWERSLESAHDSH